MNIIFEITDKDERRVRLTNKQYKHIKRHPHMQDSDEIIKSTIQNPTTIRYSKEDEALRYFYEEFKEMPPGERYLFVSVKYLNGEGFIITSFYTNKITGSKWNI